MKEAYTVQSYEYEYACVTFQPAVKQAGGRLLRATRVPAGQQVLGDQRQVDHGG